MRRCRPLSVVVTMLLAVLMLASCTGNNATTPPATAAQTVQASSELTAAAETATVPPEPVTLDYFMADTPDLYNGWQWGDDPITKVFTQACGVALNVRWAASSGKEELYTMLASGTNFPDIMRTKGYEPQLIDEKYVLALNELADEYCPEFNSNLPYQFREIYNSADGNLYCLTRDYADEKKLATIDGGAMGTDTVCINRPLYEQLGKPPVNTLDELTAAIKMAADKGSEYPVHIDAWMDPSVAWNGAQVINRSFGGDYWMSIQNGDSIQLNVRSDEYKAALNYLNDLYKLGYVQPRNFTFQTSNDEQLNDFANNGLTLVVLGQPWGLEVYRQGLTDEWYYPIDPPAAAGVNQADIKLYDISGSSIGGNGYVWVMDGTEQPSACIRLLSYMLTDEAQIMSRWGIEGTHYTLGADGHIVVNAELDAQAAKLTNPDKMNLTGYLNRVSWMMQGKYAYNYFFYPNDGTTDGERISLGKKYGENCKLQNLCNNLTNTDDVQLRTNVLGQWAKEYANCIFADSKDEFAAAYSQMIANMEKVGLKDLETLYTKYLAEWKSKGIG